MAHYLLLNYLPAVDGDASASWGGMTKEQMAEQHAQWLRYDQELKAAGVLVHNTGLDAPTSATTVRVRGGETQLTDGPFAETKEYLGGYFLIDVPDLDAAVDWAARMPSSRYGAVEVRPAWGAA